MLADTINNFIESRLSSVYTALPGVVTKILGNVADVQPAVSEMGVVLPVLPDVPIVFPASKTAGLVFDVAVGDSVLLIFTTSSIDEWLAGSGSLADTDDPRRFDVTDAVAIPGLFSLKSAPILAPTDGCVMNYEDTTVTIKKNGDVVIGGVGATALVKEAVLSTLSTHTHPVPQAPSGTLESLPSLGLATLATNPANKTSVLSAV